MNERIREIRKLNKLSQQKFADILGLTQNYVWMIEKGTNIPSDRTIRDICREFRVSEEWLRTGNGAMTVPLTKESEIALITNQLIKEKDTFRYRLFKIISELDEEELDMIYEIIKRLSEEEE